MSQFKYTLPSGNTFTMNAPEGTTPAQADFIFYSQVASGSLVGFAPGQSISSIQSATIKFALSRLDRGTAGTDEPAILAINNGTGITTDQTILSIVNGITTTNSIPNLINVPLENPINQADFVNITANNTFSPTPIGPLDSSQVQGLMAQLANFVGQPAGVISQTLGIGIYGAFCEQLEQAGYVKPGTYLQFIAPNENDFISTMSSPSVWTGFNGIYDLGEFLNSLLDQNTAQLILLQIGYDSLIATGVITPPATRSVNAAQGFVYTANNGLQTVSQLSVNTGIFISTGSSASQILAGTPLASLLSTPLTNTGSLASGATSNLSTGNLSSISASLTATINKDIGALITNASKFGTTLAADWSKSSGIDNLSSLTNLNIGSITGKLNNLGLSNLSGLTSQIQNLNVLGKASQFATSFSNPVASLNTLGNNIVGQLQGQATAITGQLQAQLGKLGGLFSGGSDSLVSATKVAAGFSNTVNRSVVDSAVTRVIGSSKIPIPKFDFPLPGSVSADIKSAQQFLQNVKNQSNQLVTTAGQQLTSATQQLQSLVPRV